MESLIQLFAEFNTYAKSNPIVAGAVSLWGLGVVTWILRKVPSNIYFFFKRQFTTTLTFNNTTMGTNLETFANFLRWYENNKWAKYSRSLSLNGAWSVDEQHGTVVGIGNGFHFFFYNSRPFWMHRQQMTEGAMHQVVFEITITAVGRSRQIIMDLIDEFRYKPQPDKIGIFTLNDREWFRMTDIGRRRLETVIVNRKLKAELIDTIDKFMVSRQWYEDRGLPYKKTFILHGVGGTGKTSLIKALAGHYNLNICRINLSMMSDSSLEHALATGPKKAMFLIEDFDSAPATRSRYRRSTDAAPDSMSSDEAQLSSLLGTQLAPRSSKRNGPTPARQGNELSLSMLTLSGILNALDGVVSLDERLVFMTTNVLDQIDPHLLRKGRVDETYELKALRHSEVCDYIEVMYPGHSFVIDGHFTDILGCDLQAIYMNNSDDGQTFVNVIPRDLSVFPGVSTPTIHHPPIAMTAPEKILVYQGEGFNNGC